MPKLCYKKKFKKNEITYLPTLNFSALTRTKQFSFRPKELSVRIHVWIEQRGRICWACPSVQSHCQMQAERFVPLGLRFLHVCPTALSFQIIFSKLTANIHSTMLYIPVHFCHHFVTFVATRGLNLFFLVCTVQGRVFNWSSSNSHQIFIGPRSRLQYIFVTHLSYLWPLGSQLSFISFVCSKPFNL